MTGSKNNFNPNIEHDPHAPVFTGARLDRLRNDWLRASENVNAGRFKDVPSIKSIALIGAVRNHNGGKLNIRDELACRAIMRGIIPRVPLSADCPVDLYNLSEGKDIFSADKTYDLAILCNIRELLPVVMWHYNNLAATGRLAEVLQEERHSVARGGYGHDLDRVVADALMPSDILSGIKFSGVTREHAHYVTVSKEAMKPGAYANLAAKLKSRFVASWGFVQFIHGGYFSTPSIYDLAQPPGQRLIKAESFTLTQQDVCGLELIQPYIEAARKVMPQPPYIHFAVRNDVLENIAIGDREAARTSPLFKQGIDLFEKLDLLARMQDDRGRRPVARSWKAAGKSLTEWQAMAARPLNFMERAERLLRRRFG